MTKVLGAVVATALVLSASRAVRADGPDAKVVIDKAIQALGGEQKLTGLEAKTVETKAKGTIVFNGNEGTFTQKVTTTGIDHFRRDFEGDFGGTPVKGVTVMAGDKGWRKFGGNTSNLEDDQFTNEKRTIYLQLVPASILPLKGKDFKVESTKEEKVDNKPAVGLKIIGPDKKDFELYFDKETGLPVKLVAVVKGFMGEDFKQETTFGNWKEFDGVKRATKVVTLHDGQKFIDLEITDVKSTDKADPKTFTEPAAD
jgi:hypothetical protein